MEQQQLGYIEKSVVICRDEHGFGLRVSGQNPVYVEFVHENGAAWKAGVRSNDKIIKVNGTLVKSLNHQLVVHMIQNCTPFVNLTLHSPKSVNIASTIGEQASSYVTNSSIQTSTNTAITNNLDSPTNNITVGSGGGGVGGLYMNTNPVNNPVIHPSLQQQQQRSHHNHPHHSHQQHSHHHLNLNHNHHQQQPPHHHPIANNLNWLSKISDDLFQDNLQKHQQFQSHDQHETLMSTSPSTHQTTVGVSKLVVGGPSPLNSVHHQSPSSSNGKPKLRHGKNSSSTRDNPYYYYKTTTADKANDECSTNASSSLISQDQLGSRSSPSIPIVRSRSSAKMSIRSSSSKHKSRNFRSRLVEDFRSLTIANSQATPSSLSSSPSSSELSDCDDTDSSRVDCPSCPSMNTSNSSNSCATLGNSANMPIANQQQNTLTSVGGNKLTTKSTKLRYTSHRFEIIRELIDTEKTHVEKLKHLNDLIYKPIKTEGLIPVEQIKMVFSCHKTLYKVHRQIYRILLAAQQNSTECPKEPLVGKALLDIFEGECGKRLEKAASTFCACQATNTDLLNRYTRKDTKAGEFLAQVANQQLLGRLGIKDLLASCFQRLTKYPLLLENLLKATPAGDAACGIHSKSLSEGSIATSLTSIATSTVTATSTVSSVINESTKSDESINMSENLDSNYEQTKTLSSQTSSSSSQQTTTNTAEAPTIAPRLTKTPASGNHNNNNNNYSNDDNSDEEPIMVAGRQRSAMTQTQPTAAINSATTNDKNAKTDTSNNIVILDDNNAYERLCITRALDQSRKILRHVNEAVNRAMSHNKLRDIWKKTDKHPQLPVIDIETQRLLHEGPLTLRLAKRTFDVHVLLLTHYLVILIREGQDKYKLKFFTVDGKKPMHLSPIFDIDEHLATRDSATDENGFYLLCKRKENSRICEFASHSPLERAKWKEKIHMAQTNNFAVVLDDDTINRNRRLISLAVSSDSTLNNSDVSIPGKMVAPTTGAQGAVGDTVSAPTLTGLAPQLGPVIAAGPNAQAPLPPPTNTTTTSTFTSANTLD